MFDFLKVVKTYQKGRYYYRPTFIAKSSLKDIMTRSGEFYAIFDETTGFWTKSKTRAIELIDIQVREYTIKDAGNEAMGDEAHGPVIQYMADSSNMLVTQFERFCKTLGDSWIPLDQKVLFTNSEIKKSDYATKTLNYPLQECQTPYYDTMCSVLYLPDEQEKWEWAVGAALCHESNKLQKMFAFYGEPGTGKSTIISKIIAELIFGGLDNGYVAKFEAVNLVGGDSFGTDFLENDSVVIYDDDAEMDRINARSTLNKIVSHESVRVNAKFKRPFMIKPTCIMFVGTNDPIQLSPNSGMKRRLIDIRPTGNLLTPTTYDECMEHIPFEVSGIAWKCCQVYKKLGRHYYDHYIAEDMLARTSPFHNFVIENVFDLQNGISLAKAYDLYCRYAEASKFKNIMIRYKFRDTLKLYFKEYNDTKFEGFRWEKIGKSSPLPVVVDIPNWLDFNSETSLLDDIFSDYLAQYETDNKEYPLKFPWDKCPTKLKDLDTSKIHYVLVPEELCHIVIDFDISGEDGKKNFEKNLKAASKFPPTYAELSKSGEGIHLHYIYTGGDPNELSRMFDSNIEIKVFKGKSALRRKVTRCNSLPIAAISTGLPLAVKGGKDVIDKIGFKDEKKLRATIIKALRNADKSDPEYGKLIEKLPASHKCSIDFINELLKGAYESGKTYDVRDLQQSVTNFAMDSSNKMEYCINLVSRMHFCSSDLEKDEKEDVFVNDDAPIVFFDIEVSPDYDQYVEYCKDHDLPIDESFKGCDAHFLICWKFQGEDKAVSIMLDPSPEEVESLFKYNLIGFNNRNYDNHMVWARAQGYTFHELYELNCNLINNLKKKDVKFRQANNISKTDIFDFASASNKQGLKKWEIQLKIDHLEWNRPWYEPIPNDKLTEWCEYCTNDVTSTEKVFDYLQDDYEAREILAKIAGGTTNDTTNILTTKLLTDGISNPQSQYIYTDLSTIFPGYEYCETGIDKSRYNEGTKIIKGKSIYMGEDPGEGGYALCPNPGIYYKVALLDVASMHPHSAIKLKIFGEEITRRYEALVEARVAIKHIRQIGDSAYEKAIKYMDVIRAGSSQIIIDILAGLEGDALKKKCKAIANALKTAINSVYGLTSAKFDNKLRDPRNVDNIVAKYGALFMITLKYKIQEMGYTVVHIKTDSIKIANADEKIINFVMEFGKKYGYTFEHEATYDRICIVDDAQYVAYEVEADGEPLENPFWTVTGAKFAPPYLFKTMFSHEEIIFDDYCETKSVTDAAIHLLYPEGADIFVGRVGSFVCVKEGAEMMRVAGNKYSYVAGTKGYLWREAENVRSNPEELNLDYYRKNIDDAIATINSFGDYYEFVNVN